MDSSLFFGIKVPDWKDVESPVTKQEESVMQITRIALDLAKTVIQAHAVDRTGKPVLRKVLRPRQLLPFFRDLPYGPKIYLRHLFQQKLQ
jgi:hypothetical protein